MKVLKSLSAAALAASLGTAALAQDVIIGVPNWTSVRGTAHILKVAIEDNLGRTVELQNGTNPIIFEAMDSGAMHVHPEVWLPNQQNLHDTFVSEKASVTFNPNAVLSDQQICVTKDTQERTGISALSDLTIPIWPRTSIPMATVAAKSGSVVPVGRPPMSRKSAPNPMGMTRQ